MTHSFWHKIAAGMHIGLAKYAFHDDGLAQNYDERIAKVHAKFMVGLHVLGEFSTQDYAYDRGGQSINGNDLAEYEYEVWKQAQHGI